MPPADHAALVRFDFVGTLCNTTSKMNHDQHIKYNYRGYQMRGYDREREGRIYSKTQTAEEVASEASFKAMDLLPVQSHSQR